MDKTTPDDSRGLITFQIGMNEFCVDIMAVREIRGWTQATPLPYAPDYVCGMINLRGAVLSIIDLAARLGFTSTKPTSRHVIIVVQIGDQIAGLLVDAVTGILAMKADQIAPTPNVASALSQTFVSGVLALDARMISVIGLGHILPALLEHVAA